MTVKVTGLKKFAQRLESINRSLDNRRTVHAQSVVLYEQWVKRNFVAQGRLHDDSRLRWQRLSFATLQIRRTRKRAPTKSNVILQDTGQLRQRWFRFITNESGRLKSGQNYSKYHEKGPRQIRVFGRGRATLPRRKIFPARKQGVKIIRPAIDRYIKTIMKG